MITILIPIKNKDKNNTYRGMVSLYSALKVPDLDAVRVLDSGDWPLMRVPVFGDFLKACEYKGIKVYYQYDTSLSVSQARYRLISQADTDYIMFLDADVVIDNIPFSGFSHAFIAPSVINTGNVIYHSSEGHPWLKQFKEHKRDVSTVFAGMFGLIFSKQWVKGAQWDAFQEYVKDVWPYEDAILSRYLCIASRQLGIIKKGYRVFHLGKTRKEFWNFTLARTMESNIAGCDSIEELLEVAAHIKA